MQPNEADTEELPDRHARPAVIVCIGNHESRQCKKEIYGEIRVFDQGPRAAETKRIVEKMEDHNQKCCAPSQAIQHFKMLFSAARTVNSDRFIHLPAPP